MSLFWTYKNKIKIWLKAFSLKRIKRRTSLLISFRFRASMSLEACLVIPLFLLFMMSILYSFQIIHLQTQSILSLHQAGNAMVLQAYNNDEGLTGDLVILKETCRVKPFLLWLSPGNLSFQHEYYGHAWVGYDVARGVGGESLVKEYVYVAEFGTVYHRIRECTYLDLSVRSVDRKEIGEQRNKSGGSYHPCEICGDFQSSIYYITDYGSRCHGRRNCSGLKRTIFRITLEEAAAQGMGGCSKCG